MTFPLRARLAGKPILLEAGRLLTEPVEFAYRDTPTEALQRVIASMDQGRPWRDAVADEYAQSNRWLCDIVASPSRSRFFDEHPFPNDSLVLDVGAGWGQTTLPLAARHRIVSVEPTPERIEFIIAAAKQEDRLGRIAFLQASALNVEFDPIFDYVCCIGVLEWVAHFHRKGAPREVQREFLTRLLQSLRPGGECVIGIENRLGLKYLLGAADDHTGLSGVSVLDQARAAALHRDATGVELRCFTYSLHEYGVLLREAGFANVRAFAAFPDYKLPEFIWPADQSLNHQILSRPFTAEHNGSNGQRLPENTQAALASHYRSLAEQGISHYFAPSYFLVASAPV